MRKFERVVLVVIDGLRPDAITPQWMPNLAAFAAKAWQPRTAETVRPSVTVAALSSLATGVSPATHRLVDSGFTSLSQLRALRPLPVELRRVDVVTSVVTGELQAGTQFLVGGLLRLGGIERLIANGSHPRSVMTAVVEELGDSDTRRCVIGYLNDADIAGHAWGWMSQAYLTAAQSIDRALGRLSELAAQPGTLVIVTADHGGGGVLASDHDHPHPLNERIPVLMGGMGLATMREGNAPASLLDIPPTILHAVGGRPPAQWEGRILSEAFEREPAWMTMPA
jgi:predicted AlkP superfamily pyrophosphatase or phosphodiesterase